MVAFILMIVFLYMIYSVTRHTEKPDKSFLIASAIFLVLLFGSRHYLYSFSDDKMYYLLYNSYIDKPFYLVKDAILESRDYGFYLMTWALAQVIPWPQFLMYFQSFILFTSLFCFVKKYSINAFNSVIYLFGSGIITFYMSACRQAMAFSFCLIAYLLYDKEKRKFIHILLSVVFFYMGYTMHRSAIAMAVIFAFGIVKNERLRYILATIFTLFVVLFREKFLSSANEIMEDTYRAEYNMSPLGFLIQTILISGPIILLILKYFNRDLNSEELLEKDEEDRSVQTISLIVGIVFYVLRAFALLLERVAVYFTPFGAIMYPYAIEKRADDKEKRTVYFIVNILCIILFLWRMRNAIRGIDYVFFWQKNY